MVQINGTRVCSRGVVGNFIAYSCPFSHSRHNIICTASAPIKQAQQNHAGRSCYHANCTRLSTKIPRLQSFAPNHATVLLQEHINVHTYTTRGDTTRRKIRSGVRYELLHAVTNASTRVVMGHLRTTNPSTEWRCDTISSSGQAIVREGRVPAGTNTTTTRLPWNQTKTRHQNIDVKHVSPSQIKVCRTQYTRTQTHTHCAYYD